ncbi:uncharacterized protein AC631_02529 [Debaryomyces fabryi]|uniref:Uncharacterized protein n=1 Tax=Debaryomyces fabryi TaxID=58627 RepID=A0A0V1PZT0_9ASCO|nr:uncharacterized protein AC631_02529 [Debaryomyces fabryi]KSA01721.1 hypothetical protein AC631_02529 [Debaryomyces fabryi]CUM45242.1 unnamed protein product [Debaryomyces fabryi]
MKFSTIYSLALGFLTAQTLAAPANENEKRDDDKVVIHLTSTVQNTKTNTHIVEGTMSTHTNWIVNTATETYTHYTATVTSTVFGTPYTYTTVASTPIQNKEAAPSTDDAQDSGATETAAPENNDATQVTSTEAVTDSPDSTADADAPQITPQSATSSDSWIIENVSTVTSNSVCFVNYDYYYADEEDDTDTVTSTSTIYTTVTQS